ncbi:MAG: M48 family metalloprotease [Candidatus Omnitrophica bacterium]|nr:M48 family metalloprotease [Candidatus Omnitrophota bacterium]
MRKRLFFRLIAVMMCIFLSGCVQRYYNTATGKEEVYFYSTEKEVKIGESLSRQAESVFKLENDPLIQQRVNAVGQKLAEVCGRKEINYFFKVLDEKEINAFALPGGYVYIFRGLWDKIEKNDSLIAAVLSHEIAHITTRHSIKRLQSSLGYNALAVLVGVSHDMDAYSRSKAMAGINELILSYSRNDELEADVLALDYLKKAGFDVQCVIEVLQILQQAQRDKPIQGAYLQTHPYITERMKAVKENLNMGNIGFDDYINTQPVTSN